MSYRKKEYTVLIIEDNPSTVNQESNAIKRMGETFKAICVSNDYDKIDDSFIKKNKITTIILDIELGDNKLGIDIAKRIRNSTDEMIRKIPIIIISMLEEKEEIIKETQCNYFFCKPCHTEDITAAVLNSTDFLKFFEKYVVF